jgi:hypothetical protein
METQKEYLNEEKYQKANAKIKIAGNIVLLIGLGLIGFGIYNLVAANSKEVPKMSDSGWLDTAAEQVQQQFTGTVEAPKMKVPKMGDSGWFDKTVEQGQQKFTGTSLCMIGVFTLVAGCIIRFVIPNRRSILAYQVQQVRPVAQEGIEKVAPSVGVAAKEIAKGVKEGLKENEK